VLERLQQQSHTPLRAHRNFTHFEPSNRTSSTPRKASKEASAPRANLLRRLLLPPERSLRARQGKALPNLSRRRGQPESSSTAQLCVPPRTHAFGLGLRPTTL